MRLLLVMVTVAGLVAWVLATGGDLSRLAGDGTATPLPTASRAVTRDGWNRIDVRAGPGGHFLLEAQVDGVPVTFLVDSGASGIVLSPEDGARLGHTPGRLRYTQRFHTANGIVLAAPVKLRELRIGQLAMSYLDASINEAPIGVSLLGMSFLNRLEAWEARGDRLLLYW
jgi:aspartyl protease family protein